VNERQIAIARVYARSMLDLAEQRAESEVLMEELRQLAGGLETNPELSAFLASPFIDVESKRKAIEKLLRGAASDLLVDSLQVINRKKRLELLPAIATAYRQEYEKANDIVEVHAVTAVPLTPELRESVRASAARFTGKNVRLEERVDPSLIGGLVLRVGDQKLDGSVASDLARLKTMMLERAGRESQRATNYLEVEGDE
jgi:F-type H+-transporting ATPase subunit delta